MLRWWLSLGRRLGLVRVGVAALVADLESVDAVEDEVRPLRDLVTELAHVLSAAPARSGWSGCANGRWPSCGRSRLRGCWGRGRIGPGLGQPPVPGQPQVPGHLVGTRPARTRTMGTPVLEALNGGELATGVTGHRWWSTSLDQVSRGGCCAVVAAGA